MQTQTQTQTHTQTEEQLAASEERKINRARPWQGKMTRWPRACMCFRFRSRVSQVLVEATQSSGRVQRGRVMRSVLVPRHEQTAINRSTTGLRPVNQTMADRYQTDARRQASSISHGGEPFDLGAARCELETLEARRRCMSVGSGQLQPARKKKYLLVAFRSLLRVNPPL